MAILRTAAVLAVVVGSAAASASAQSAAPAAGSNAAVPEKTAPGSAPATDLDGKPGSLSSKLGDTNGVIKPKGDVDPVMPKTAPTTGGMPVIKPGETGGGVAK